MVWTGGGEEGREEGGGGEGRQFKWTAGRKQAAERTSKDRLDAQLDQPAEKEIRISSGILGGRRREEPDLVRM